MTPPIRRPVTSIDTADELTGFEGSLGDIGFPTLLSILETERRTGVLVLKLAGRRKAQLHLRKGRVLRARMERGKGPSHAELVYRLIAVARGTFDFRPSFVVPGDDVRCPTQQLLLEGVRRLNQVRSVPDAGAPPSRRLAAVVATIFVFLLLTVILWSGLRAPRDPYPVPPAGSRGSAPP